jgi:hypothetical protein
MNNNELKIPYMQKHVHGSNYASTFTCESQNRNLKHLLASIGNDIILKFPFYPSYGTSLIDA